MTDSRLDATSVPAVAAPDAAAPLRSLLTSPGGAPAWMRWLAVVVLLACYPAQAWLPERTGWENSWIENSQVVVLGCGLVLAFFWGRASSDAQVRALCRAACVLWFILMARELSWGGALIAPVDFTAEGPFYSSRNLWYKSAVHPLLALLLAYCAYTAVRSRLDRLVWSRLPAVRVEVVLVVAGMVLSTCAEGHGPHWIDAWMGSNRLVVEEWAELAAYFALVAAQWRVLSHGHLRHSQR